jgi:hypothetical protein
MASASNSPVIALVTEPPSKTEVVPTSPHALTVRPDLPVRQATAPDPAPADRSVSWSKAA